MTELSFKGKEFVYNHHLAVPFRPLVPDETKGIGPVALDGNPLAGIAERFDQGRHRQGRGEVAKFAVE